MLDGRVHIMTANVIPVKGRKTIKIVVKEKKKGRCARSSQLQKKKKKKKKNR